MPDVDRAALAVARRHAPLLWLHADEAFLPVDPQAMLSIAELRRDGLRVPDQPRVLDDLPVDDASEGHELAILGLDNRQFLPSPGGLFAGRVGPRGIAEQARALFGRSLGSRPAAGKARDLLAQPKLYARVVPNVFSGQADRLRRAAPEPRDPRRAAVRAVFEELQADTWTLVEYFFFFVYNDHFNQHQADWDAQVQVFVRGERPRFVVFRFHESRWVARTRELTPELDPQDWLDGWNAADRGAPELGEVLAFDGHPCVFVAQGAHGAYPTPGFTLYGVGVPGDDLLVGADERQIGGPCLVPPGLDTRRPAAWLAAHGVPPQHLLFAPWPDPELIDPRAPSQRWLRYRGHWGARADYRLWDAPREPPIGQPANPFALTGALAEFAAAGYRGGRRLASLGALASWHGWVVPSTAAQAMQRPPSKPYTPPRRRRRPPKRRGQAKNKGKADRRKPQSAGRPRGSARARGAAPRPSPRTRRRRGGSRG